MMLIITEEVIERCAKAFSAECDRLAAEDGVKDIPNWEEMEPESREHFRCCTRAALEAI